MVVAVTAAVAAAVAWQRGGIVVFVVMLVLVVLVLTRVSGELRWKPVSSRSKGPGPGGGGRAGVAGGVSGITTAVVVMAKAI